MTTISVDWNGWATSAESADGLCTESEAAGARTEDPELSSTRWLKSCPRKAYLAMKPKLSICIQP